MGSWSEPEATCALGGFPRVVSAMDTRSEELGDDAGSG